MICELQRKWSSTIIKRLNLQPQILSKMQIKLGTALRQSNVMLKQLVRIWTHKNADEKERTSLWKRKNAQKRSKADEKRILRKFTLNKITKICSPDFASKTGISRQHRDAKAFSDCLFLTTVEGLSLRGE